jgi:hypothetical protein
MFPPGWLSRATMPLATASPTFTNTIGIVRVSRWRTTVAAVPFVRNDVGLQADQLLRERSYPIDVTVAPTKLHPHVAAVGPTQVRKRLRERREASLIPGIILVARHEHADAPYAVALLPVRRERPRRRAAEHAYELAPPNHSITSSARA